MPCPCHKAQNMDDRQFKGVWIPAEIWLDGELTLTEKALLAEIDSFSGNGKTFYKSNDTIVQEYKVSRSTVSRAIKRLAELGYITASSDGRNRHLCTRSVVKMNTLHGQNDDAACSKSTPTNTREKTDNNTLKESEVVMPFDSKEFAEAWRTYLDMRKAQHRFTFKTAASEQVALHKLQNMSNHHEPTAIAIIGESVAWGWKGLFPLKQNTQHGQTGTSDGSLIAAHLAKLGSNT